MYSYIDLEKSCISTENTSINPAAVEQVWASEYMEQIGNNVI